MTTTKPRPEPPPACARCGATSDLVLVHWPARTGMAASDAWYCGNLTTCDGNKPLWGAA